MSILSRLFGKKEPTVVAEPKKTRKPPTWKYQKCAGSGQPARMTEKVKEIAGKNRKLGMCPECGRLGVPTKGNDLVGAHYPVATG